MEPVNSSRREVLKKATFILPALTTFQLSELTAHATSVGVASTASGSSNGNNGHTNNGKHLGQYKNGTLE